MDPSDLLGPHAGRRAGLPVPRGAGAGCRLSSASAARVKFVPPETSSRCFLLRASCISLGFPQTAPSNSQPVASALSDQGRCDVH